MANPVPSSARAPSAYAPTPGTQPESRGGPRPAPGTLTQLFFEAAERYDRPDALQVKANGAYQPISHRTVVERVRHLALGLQELGVARGDRVALLSENRPEWAIADFACLTVGITDVPVYPTLPAEQAQYVIADSGARVVFASTPEQVAKIAAVRAQLPAVTHVVCFAGERCAGADLTLAELERRGAAAETPERVARYRAEARAVKPDDLATLIYTSGTTGAPKGVMLTHDNFHSNVAAAARCIPFEGRDVALSFLPLSHVFERMGGHYLMWHTGTSIAYAESVETVANDMGIVRPTLMLSVPRLYEKMYARVLENAVAGGPTKLRIFTWARGVADRWADEKLAGREPGGLLAVQYRIAQKLVFSKLKARTGGNLRYFVSGGAPLSPEINKFFYAAGLVILEGYGLTETSPVIAVNTPSAFKLGTVGRPVDGVEVRIAADGEILTRGPHVMRGYYQKVEETAAMIDPDGWLHTGDIGQLEDGYLRITDRKKDIIVTAGGKNIAPQPIEGRLKTNKFVLQAVMLGDKRPYPVLLVVPNREQLEPWARAEGLTWTTAASLLALPEVQAKMEREVLGQLAGLASFETPKRIALLEHDFTIDGGELTPKLSVKRRVVEERHRAAIDAMYRDA